MDVQATVVLKGGTLTSSFDADAGEESTVVRDTEISAARVEGVGTLLSPEGTAASRLELSQDRNRSAAKAPVVPGPPVS